MSESNPSIPDDLNSRAASLINPASGIANDYLNTFNELLLLIENMPVLLPEMIEDLERWEPRTYRDYFSTSPLPGSSKALSVYASLDMAVREAFEQKIARLTEIASISKSAVLSLRRKNGVLDPDDLVDICAVLASRVRDALSDAENFVNNGRQEPTQKAQEMADQLMKQSA